MGVVVEHGASAQLVLHNLSVLHIVTQQNRHEQHGF